MVFEDCGAQPGGGEELHDTIFEDGTARFALEGRVGEVGAAAFEVLDGF